MPVSTIGNRHSDTFDKLLELRSAALAPVALSANEPAIAFAGPIHEYFKAVITHTPYTGYVATTNFWSWQIAASVDNITFFPVATMNAAGTISGLIAQYLDIALSGAMIEDIVPNAKFIRVGAVRTGAPGPLSYGAFLAADNE